jgi:S-layer homology domain
VTRQAMAAFLRRFDDPNATDPACTSAPFRDVPITNAFCPQIEWLVAHHIATGYSDGGFHPSAGVSRQAMAAFMYRLINPGSAPPSCTAAAFSDVPASNPFCGAIQWLARNGVTVGFPDGSFHPIDLVSRQAMAAFLHRLAQVATSS